RHLLLICSTHGDGDPPEPVHGFHSLLMDERAPRLPELRYAVLALGDSSYERFCEAGRQFDERLAALGAQRLVPRQECDVDFAEPAKLWMDSVLELLPRQESVVLPAIAVQPAGQPEFSRQNPLATELLGNVCLSAPE